MAPPTTTRLETSEPAPADAGQTQQIPPMLALVFGLPILAVVVWFVLPGARSPRPPPPQDPPEPTDPE